MQKTNQKNTALIGVIIVLVALIGAIAIISAGRGSSANLNLDPIPPVLPANVSSCTSDTYPPGHRCAPDHSSCTLYDYAADECVGEVGNPPEPIESTSTATPPDNRDEADEEFDEDVNYDQVMLKIYQTYRALEAGISGNVDYPYSAESCNMDAQEWSDFVEEATWLVTITHVRYTLTESDIRTNNKHLAGDIAWGIADHYLQLAKAEYLEQVGQITDELAGFAKTCGLSFEEADHPNLYNL